MAGEPGQPPEDLLWRILLTRAEDESLRIACGDALAARAGASTRAAALVWLLTPFDASDAAPAVARVAGTGASPQLAAQTLLARLDGALATRYAVRPFRPEARPDESVHAPRPDLWIAAIEASRIPPPWTASPVACSMRGSRPGARTRSTTCAASRAAWACLAPLAPPLEPEVQLHQAASSERLTPASPIPPEVDDIVRAILVADGNAAWLGQCCSCTASNHS